MFLRDPKVRHLQGERTGWLQARILHPFHPGVCSHQRTCVCHSTGKPQLEFNLRFA